jgi:hypothetical protein
MKAVLSQQTERYRQGSLWKELKSFLAFFPTAAVVDWLYWDGLDTHAR